MCEHQLGLQRDRFKRPGVGRNAVDLGLQALRRTEQDGHKCPALGQLILLVIFWLRQCHFHEAGGST